MRSAHPQMRRRPGREAHLRMRTPLWPPAGSGRSTLARSRRAGYSWRMDQDTSINKILAEAKTIAVVGFSSVPQKAGYYVPAYLQQQGYRIIPVNPNPVLSLIHI